MQSGCKGFRKKSRGVLSLLEQQGRPGCPGRPKFCLPNLKTGRPTVFLVGMLRKLGFSLVLEVAFGADLVTDRYLKLLYANPGRTIHYHPTVRP
jgi:hypothetical protein